PTANKDGHVAFTRRNGFVRLTKPLFQDGTGIAKDEKRTRREVLADRIVGHENFARGRVNLVWTRLFSLSLNQSGEPDNFGDHNQVMHPALLDQMAKDFVAAKYD